MRKILRTDETDFSYERERQPMPRIGPWQGQLEQFLSSNADKPSRERLTLIRIFEELRGLGYEGGYDAVRRFAKSWSQNRGAVTADPEQTGKTIWEMFEDEPLCTIGPSTMANAAPPRPLRWSL